MIRRAVKVIVPKMPGRSNFLSCLIIFWFNMISRVGQEPSIYSHSGKNVESCRFSLNPAIDWFSYCGESCLTIVGPLATQFRWPYIPSLTKPPSAAKGLDFWRKLARPRTLRRTGCKGSSLRWLPHVDGQVMSKSHCRWKMAEAFTLWIYVSSNFSWTSDIWWFAHVSWGRAVLLHTLWQLLQRSRCVPFLRFRTVRRFRGKNGNFDS